ncbi:MAG: hypothetical protein ABI654_09425 [Betaproteobacteria bacterium]
MTRFAFHVAMALACTAACAADQSVAVYATREPVDKSYRKMIRGMDLFEQKHAMAPDAALRYKLLPRQSDTNMNGIELSISGDSMTIPVDVEPDHTFVLERNQKALDEDASVRPNRKARSMTWRTEVRTPGLAPDTRRLGDLRLECHVGMEADLVSNVRSVIGQIANFLMRSQGYCDGKDAHYYFFSERPLFGVTLVAGTRREVLPAGELYAGSFIEPLSKADLAYCDCQVMLDRTYYLPLGDRSWPDDTMVEFEYMAEPATASVPVVVGNSTKAEVVAALGKTTIVSFDSGFEVWLYKRPDKTELVILFAPSGVVTKSRIR